MGRMDDPLLTALAADLDGSFERLVLAYQDLLFAVALRTVRHASEAEEVAQDAFVRAYRALAGYPAERIRELRLRPWLVRICLNLARNRLRRFVAVTAPLDGVADSNPDPADGPEAAILRREAAASWARALAAVPDRYRIPVELRHVDGLGYHEIADVLGRPLGTVKAQVHRGVMLLREAHDELTRDPTSLRAVAAHPRSRKERRLAARPLEVTA